MKSVGKVGFPLGFRKDPAGGCGIEVFDGMSSPIIEISTSFFGSMQKHQFLVSKETLAKLAEMFKQAANTEFSSDLSIPQGDLDCLGEPSPQSGWYD